MRRKRKVVLELPDDIILTLQDYSTLRDQPVEAVIIKIIEAAVPELELLLSRSLTVVKDRAGIGKGYLFRCPSEIIPDLIEKAKNIPYVVVKADTGTIYSVSLTDANVSKVVRQRGKRVKHE